MRDLTLVLPYYENAGMLCAQQSYWSGLPSEVRAHLHVIVVDDGSPIAQAAPHWAPPDLASARLFRTGVDVRWNWLFCRNLGVAKATTEWVFLTDIDHVVPAETWIALMQDALKATNVYRFSRVDAPHMTPVKEHPNTWFLTRTMFDTIGGYDERFSGYYGTDGEFQQRVKATASKVVMRRDVVVRYPRTVIQDADTTTYGRKEPQDRANVRRIRAERAVNNWPLLRLSFPWEQLA